MSKETVYIYVNATIGDKTLSRGFVSNGGLSLAWDYKDAKIFDSLNEANNFIKEKGWRNSTHVILGETTAYACFGPRKKNLID
jgi:hypothetical protein